MKQMNFMSRKLFLIYTFILAVAFTNCSSNKDYLPVNIYNHSLKRKLVGQDAKGFIDRMHLQAVTAIKNEIGFYEGQKGPATIYITFYENRAAAETEWAKMTQKISPENSVFTNGENIDVKGNEIYRCFGMGQMHFVFTDKTQLIWLSVNTLIGKTFLTEYLAYLD